MDGIETKSVSNIIANKINDDISLYVYYVDGTYDVVTYENKPDDPGATANAFRILASMVDERR